MSETPSCGLRPSRTAIRTLRTLIERSRQRVAASVNVELVMLYWRIGQRICRDILRHDKPEYGAHVVDTLARQLTAEYGKSNAETTV